MPVSELKVYFPRISKDLLKKLIIASTLSSFLGKDVRESIKEEGFLKLVGLSRLPLRKIDFFNERLKEYTPTINLKPVKENIRMVSTIKFYFKNGTYGFGASYSFRS